MNSTRASRPMKMPWLGVSRGSVGAGLLLGVAMLVVSIKTCPARASLPCAADLL